MNTLDYDQHFRETILSEKIAEILKKTKKKAIFSEENLREERGKKIQEKKDFGVVTDIKIDDDGTVKTYFDRDPYPVSSYTDLQSAWVVATSKKFIPLIAESISKEGNFKRIITILAILFNKDVLSKWLEYVFSMNSVLLEEQHYSPVVKEVRRALRSKIDDNILDGVTMILEYDSAYRYMFQDIVPLLNKDDFNKNWRKELKRVFDILISRCTNKDKAIFTNIKKLLPLYFTFNWKALKIFKQIVNEMDFTKITPTQADYYWMLWLRTYSCFGFTKEVAIEKIKELGGRYEE